MLEDLIPFVGCKHGNVDLFARIQPPRANGAKICLLLMEEQFGLDDDDKMLEDLIPFARCQRGDVDPQARIRTPPGKRGQDFYLAHGGRVRCE